MKLTKEQIEKLEKKLESYSNCPNCNCTEKPNTNNREYQLISRDRYGEGLYIDIRAFKSIATLTCTKCGYIRSFDLNVLGIIDNNYPPK